MRSWQVQCCVSRREESKYSDLQVLQSAAGFYLGTIYNEETALGEFSEPGSRDTNYLPSHEIATKVLETLEECNKLHNHAHPEFIVGDWMEKCKNRLGVDVYYRWEP